MEAALSVLGTALDVQAVPRSNAISAKMDLQLLEASLSAELKSSDHKQV